MMPRNEYDTSLADDIAGFYNDPLGYVMYNFPWDTDPSIQLIKLDPRYKERFDSEYGPDLWQCQFLDELGDEIDHRGFDGKVPVDPIRFSTVSGHEIGKSCLVAWIIKFIMDTRPFSKGSVTATTDEQLRTKTWAELSKWHAMSLTKRWFKLTSARGSMTMAHVDYPERWRCDAKTCREEKSEAFAGQHAPDSTSFYIFDEASGVPNKPFEVREGGLTSGEPMVFDFGNGTRNSGMFYENCVGRLKSRYIVRSIDSRSCSLTNKVKIEQDRVDFGEDSDFFRVRWRGLFPDSASTQFIGGELVQTAQQRELTSDRAAAFTIAVDVARFGDDESVIKPKLGKDFRSFPARKFRGLDTVQLVGQVTMCIHEYIGLGLKPAAIFIDGGGLGAGVVDQLKHLGYPVVDVQFGGRPHNQKEYRFKVGEMWGLLRDDLREGAVFPGEDTEEGMEIYEQLTQREYGHTLKGQIHLEPKDEMKKRGLSSPDLGDAYALHYAEKVAPAILGGSPMTQPSCVSDYDPHGEEAFT